MNTRTLIAEDDATKTYEVRNDSGEVVGTDVESKPTTQETNRRTIEDRAKAALDANAAFLAFASPTNAQVVAQVQRLTKECSALIRLALGLLDDTTGT